MNKSIFSTVFIFFIFSLKICGKEASYEVLSDFSQGKIWIRSSNNKDQIRETLNAILPKILSHKIFAKRLSSRWDILVDGEWSKTSGYWANDLKSPEGAPSILISANAAAFGSSSRLIVHELTHLLHYQFRPDEESWLREGVALLSEYIVSGLLNPSFEQGFAEPESSLTDPLDPMHIGFGELGKYNPQYGHLSLFFHYAYRICGGDELFDELLTSSEKANGIKFMNEILAKKNSGEDICKDFESFFNAFQRARFIPTYTSKSGYILLTSRSVKIRLEPMELGPYSASAYEISAVDAHCLPNEISWHGNRCLRIRGR